MSFKIFIDANVWLDFFLKRKDYADAEKIVEGIIEGEIDGYITVSVLQILSFYLQKDRGTLMAKKLLLQLLNDVKLIETNKDHALQALSSTFKDIEDAIHYFTAIGHQVDYIITDDLDFQKSALPILPIVSVKEFLDEILEG